MYLFAQVCFQKAFSLIKNGMLTLCYDIKYSVGFYLSLYSLKNAFFSKCFS